jgi:hypothetical protein
MMFIPLSIVATVQKGGMRLRKDHLLVPSVQGRLKKFEAHEQNANKIFRCHI